MAYKSAFSLFQTSKEAVLNNFSPFLLVVFLPSFLIIVGEAMNGGRSWMLPAATAPASEGSQLVQMTGGLLSLLLLPAGMLLELQTAKGKHPGANEVIRASLGYFWRILGLMLLITIIVGVGILALIVPGLFFLQRLFLAPYFLIDRNLSIREAMSTSWEASKNKGGPIWGVIGVIVLLSVFSIIPIFGGLISTVLLTLYTVAPAYRYFEIAKKQ